eukprot:TRINITY_DN8921_c0_g1_i2.p1 TRINITY_DN8921_c0_g1~~TRINITY_DN8921_c0_g1_i2.p1  ORF type:complete len:169 (-),score=36.21 TRINITY_DN8921_c0_g1_i2:67-573(-)
MPSPLRSIMGLPPITDSYNRNLRLVRQFEIESDARVEIPAIFVSVTCMLSFAHHKHVIDFGYDDYSFVDASVWAFLIIQLLLEVCTDICVLAYEIWLGEEPLDKDLMTPESKTVEFLYYIGAIGVTIMCYRLVPLIIFCPKDDVCSCFYKAGSQALKDFCDVDRGISQ